MTNKTYVLTIVSIIVVSFVCCFAFMGCTENSRAKSFGGSAKIDLPAGQKLVNVTWKDSNIWYLTRPMRSDEKAESYTFQEKSNFGALEGTYILQENK